MTPPRPISRQTAASVHAILSAIMIGLVLGMGMPVLLLMLMGKAQ